MCNLPLLVAQLYTFKNFNHKDGLNFSCLTSGVQTSDGQLWFGTANSGIVRYDGLNFKELEFLKGDNNHSISSLCKGNSDEIYFTSLYKGVFKLSSKGYELIYKNFRKQVNYLNVYSSENNLFVVTKNQLLVFRNRKLVLKKEFNKSITDSKSIRFIETNTGVIFISESDDFFISKDLNFVSPLFNYLGINQLKSDKVKFGFYLNKKLTLFNSDLSEVVEVIFTSSGSVWSRVEQHLKASLAESEKVTTFTFDKMNNKSFFITNLGTLFEFQFGKYKKVIPNSFEKPIGCNFGLTDLNGNNWFCSNLKGLYKISIEPFVKIELDPIFESSLITMSFKSVKGDFILSNEGGQTNIGSHFKSVYKSYNFTSYSACEKGNNIYLGTSDGLKLYNTSSKKITDISLPELIHKKIHFVFYDDEKTIWLGVEGEGLMRYNPFSNSCIISENLYSGFPFNFYTAQKSFDNNYIVFGGDNGLHQFDIKTRTFFRMNDIPNELGAFCGLSVIDKFQTRWFALEKGLVGITKNNNKRVIQNKDNFVSFNFRTLNSDRYGNLIIGTNKGLTILSLNKSGKVLKSKSYNGKSGFTGYETRLRSQFQNNKSIYLGTAEGLFLINSSLLNNLPIESKPTLNLTSLGSIKSNEPVTFTFNYKVNNPRIENVYYTYRLIGGQNEWSSLSPDTNVVFHDLSDKIYTFQVKATLDGVHFSEIAQKKMVVKKPFWTSNVFVLSLIVLFLGLNIYFFNKIKSFDAKTIFSNKDNTITTKLIPRIILVSNLINITTHFVGHELDHSIPLYISFFILSGFLVFIIYLFSLSTARLNNKNGTKILLIIALSIVLVENFIDLYLSNLHFYFIIIISILSILIPFIFERLRSSITYSIGVLLVSCLCFILLDEVTFNKYLFIVLLILIVCTSIFTTYLRHDSISKLLFISGVVNKGDVLAVAINAGNKIIYVSENISSFIQSTHDELMNCDITTLNSFLPQDSSKTSIFSNEKFEDGKKYLAPMISLDNSVIWIEWSCKIYSRDVKVILGQDVTKKMELETTFELLVQNAEDFIYQCDASGNFIFLNKQAILKIGYPKNELIGANFTKIIEEKHKEEVANYYLNHFRQKQLSTYFEFPISTNNGEIIWLGQHVTTLYEPGSNSRIKGFLAVARDITDKRRQEKIIEDQQNDITSSIHYAKRIQLNLLPSSSLFDQVFNESFVLFKPKDIVSGDFYWMERVNDLTVLALGDCTGHGVPGSFMTLLGINLLNSIVLENQVTSPGKILDLLDEKLIYVLPRGQGDSKVDDGMEITVCVFNHKTGELTYACAGSRFIVLSEGEIELCKLDSKHIGDYTESDEFHYSESTIQLKDSDIIYLFSDGYQDQFGGIRNKKFNFKKMREMILANQNNSLNVQKSIFENELVNWIGDFEQTDDVTIIGVKGLI